MATSTAIRSLPLRESRLSDRAAVVLAADLVSGRLSPDAPFPSADEIVQRFGVSRTVARETLQTLAMIGVVRVQHGKRTVVLPPGEWNVMTPVVQEALRREGRLEPVLRDLYEFRLVIEPPAAALMAERGDPRDLDRLAELAAEMERLAGERGDTEAFMAADEAFHKAIAQSSGNSVLAAVSVRFWEAVSVLWEESRPTGRELRSVSDQHLQIAAAIGRRDAKAAAAAMALHLNAASQMDVGHFRAPAPAGRRRRSGG